MYTLFDLYNSKISLDRNISGEYGQLLHVFAEKLNAAVKGGNTISPYTDKKMAKVYVKMCRQCTTSLEVLILIRALPHGEAIPTTEEILDKMEKR